MRWTLPAVLAELEGDGGSRHRKARVLRFLFRHRGAHAKVIAAMWKAERKEAARRFRRVLRGRFPSAKPTKEPTAKAAPKPLPIKTGGVPGRLRTSRGRIDKQQLETEYSTLMGERLSPRAARRIRRLGKRVDKGLIEPAAAASGNTKAARFLARLGWSAAE